VTDTISGGTEPRTARRRRSWRWRPPRALVAVAVAVLAVTAVVAGRAGLEPAPYRPAPVTATVARIAAGQQALYVLLDACDPGCAPRLLASPDRGRTWERRTVPAVGGSELRVSGPQDLLSLEAPDGDRLAVSADGGRTWREREVADGVPGEQVPAGLEPYVRRCVGPPRCQQAEVEWLDPETATRHRLEVQPPFPPDTVAAAPGAPLWAGGIDPRTGKFAVAVSTLVGKLWMIVPLPEVPYDAGMVARIVPAAGRQHAHLLSGYPDEGRGQTAADVWRVPVPGRPSRMLPEGPPLQVSDAVGLPDGALLLDGPTRLDTGGRLERMVIDPADPLVVVGIGRGPGGLLTGVVPRRYGAAIALADVADPFDWTVLPLPL
jgi:hypothetical protein